jgi:hypothetical protein
MGVDIPDTQPKQRPPIDEVKHFLVRGDGYLWQFSQGVQNNITLPETAESEFTRHEGMPEDPSAIEEPAERRIASPQVVDPDRCVDQDHSGFGRRLGGPDSSGSLPPRRASRRALSRSINALSASRTSADF